MNVKHTRYIPFPSPLFVSSLSPHPQRPCHVLWLSPMSSSYSSPSVIVFGSWPRWHPRCKDKCHGNAQRPQDLPQCVAYTTWSTNSSRSSFLVLVVGRRISLITRHHFLQFLSFANGKGAPKKKKYSCLLPSVFSLLNYPVL